MSNNLEIPGNTYKIYLRDGNILSFKGEDTLEIFRENWINKATNNVQTGWKSISVNKLFILGNKEEPRKRPYLKLTHSYSAIDVELPVDPYVLGCLLGDGGLTVRSQITFSSADIDLINRVVEKLPEELIIKKKPNSKYDYSIVLKEGFSRSSLNKYISDIGLKVTSEHKFVPEIFKSGSYAQKLELVRGLMDTDGTACKNGGASFCSTSLRLAEDLVSLVRDLGGMAKLCIKPNNFFTYKGERKRGKVAYIVHIRFKTPRDLFSLDRKKFILKEANQYSANLKNRIERMEIVDEPLSN